MGIRTLNARTDLTYEEIYEGYANGKSRLPRIIRLIEDGGSNAFFVLAESTGIDVFRRRTGGGNASDTNSVGVTDTTVRAKIISADRWDTLIAGYSGAAPYVNPPSANIQTVDVGRVTKEPFDLIDQVAGVNFSSQAKGSASELSGREAKLQDKGTGVRIKAIDTRLSATNTIDVTDFFADKGGSRIGSGGATGEVHGVDLGIEEEVVTMNTEAVVLADPGATFDMSGDTTFGFWLDSVTGDLGAGTEMDFAPEILTIREIADVINEAVDATLGPVQGVPLNDEVAVLHSPTQLALHSRLRGPGKFGPGLGPSSIRITVMSRNTVLGLNQADSTQGLDRGDTVSITNQEILEQSPMPLARTFLRYATVQFAVIQIVSQTSGREAAGIAANVGTNAVAYILHPDHLADLIAFQ